VATREPSGDLVRLPLARIERRDNQFLLAPYEPPVLTVPLASRLGGVVVDLAARLWSKAKYLAESQGAQELEARLRVQALVAGLPLLEEVLYSDHAHPRQLYLALCAVAGPLAFLRQEAPLPPELPRYDHTDLLATFEGAARMIVDVLEEGVSELYTNYRFELEQQRNLFHLFFDPAWEGRELRLAVRRAAAHTEQETEAWMTEALIGSQSLITGMQKSRILGVARRRAEGKGDLATSSSVLLYEVNPKSKYLKTGERLLVFNPREGARPAEIVLYVRRRDAGA
jgi:type VI secretion system protein ImpJ